MNLEKKKKNELEDFGRSVGIELDRRLTKSVLIDQLVEHLQSVDETAEDDIVESDFISPEEEWNENDISHPLMPEVLLNATPEELETIVDPAIIIREEVDARMHMHNTEEALRQIEEKFKVMVSRRIEAELAEERTEVEVGQAKRAVENAKLAWAEKVEKL
jgi:hypothetical protein